MKKRVLGLLLVLALFIGIFPATSASAAKAGAFTYKIVNGEAIIMGLSGYANFDGIIPDTLDGYPVTTIGDYAFNYSGIKKIVIPDSVTSIGGYAFLFCEDLKDVTIGSGVTEIDCYAFQYCRSLTNVTIGSNITAIDGTAFWGCGNLEDFLKLEEDSNFCFDEYGVLYSKDKKTLFCAPEEITSYTVPEGVTAIGPHAFQSRIALKKINFPDSLTTIGNDAFSTCIALTEIAIPDSVTTIGRSAFAHCRYLENLKIGSGTTAIEESAFNSCSRLVSVEMGSGVKTVSDFAFTYCDSLKDVFYDGSKTQWEAISVGTSNNYLTLADIHYAVAEPDNTQEVDAAEEEDKISTIILVLALAGCLILGFTTGFVIGKKKK